MVPHVHIAHLYKAENAVLPSPEPPPPPYADLHLNRPIFWSAITRPSLLNHSDLAFAIGLFGYTCARSVRSWKAADRSRGARHSRSCSPGRRAR